MVLIYETLDDFDQDKALLVRRGDHLIILPNWSSHPGLVIHQPLMNVPTDAAALFTSKQARRQRAIVFAGSNVLFRNSVTLFSSCHVDHRE